MPRIVTSTREAEFHSLLFTNIPTVSWSQARNWGPFWEPGAYQAFLNVALIFTLFIREKKGKHWILSSIVFTVAVISTLSTTGYLALFFIYLAYTFSNNKEKGFTNTFGKIALICLALIGAIYVVFYSDLFESVVTTKLQNEDTSRYQFVIYGMKAFAESPLIGNGASLSSVIHSFAGSDISRTNTFVAMFAIFGVLPGVYTIVCYVKMFADFRKLTTILSTMFIGVAFCCMLFGEYFIYSPIWAWLMYLVPSEYVNRSTQNLIV